MDHRFVPVAGSVYYAVWCQAETQLHHQVSKLALGKITAVRELVGEGLWLQFDDVTKQRFGRHVRANLEHFRLLFVRLQGTMSLYQRSAVLVRTA